MHGPIPSLKWAHYSPCQAISFMCEQDASLNLRRRAVQAALGEAPFDLLLTNANLIDMVTGEIRPVDVGLVGPLICEET